ncbi:MAG: hypothetical protein FJ090_14770 [Deltaproteobacteria bacterium]|nr:hypothetical protein [Deltaproteobacteria bacterium]
MKGRDYRLNAYLARSQYLAIELAASQAKLTVAEWARSRLLLAAEREGFSAEAEQRVVTTPRAD